MKHRNLKAALMVAVLGVPLEVQAYSITIQNAGFESPVIAGAPGYNNSPPTAWTFSGSGGGVWNITDFPLGFWTVPAPQGKQIAWLAPAPASPPSSLRQTLGDTVVANTKYHLSGFVGHPIGFNLGTIYTAALYANGTLLASTTGTGPAGSFINFNLLFDSTGSASVGDLLEVRLETNQAQTGFDRIALNANSVPDGGLTALLLAMGMTGLGWMRRRMR